MKKIKILSSLMIFLSIFCDGEDITGKIVVEYDGDWSAVIIENYTESSFNGTGKKEFIYKNPDSLKITAAKEDPSYNKIIVYIYEDERITAGDSTRDPEGSVSAEYEFPF